MVFINKVWWSSMIWIFLDDRLLKNDFSGASEYNVLDCGHQQITIFIFQKKEKQITIFNVLKFTII